MQPTKQMFGRLTKLKSLDKKQRRTVLLAIALPAVAAVAGFIWWDNRPLLDPTITGEANFPVYAPKAVPSGYKLERDRTSLSDDVLTYIFEDKSGERDITVTVQPRPASFNMSQMVQGGSIDAVSTNRGMMYNLSIGGSSRYLLDSGDALIFFTSPTQVDKQTVTSLADSLNKLK